MPRRPRLLLLAFALLAWASPAKAEDESPLPPLPAPSLAEGSRSLQGMSSISRNRIVDTLGEEAPPEFPNIHDEPGKRYGMVAGDHDPFVFPWAVNLITEDLWMLEPDPVKARAARLKRSRRIDIRDPDPDLANFPNGAYTLPKGRAYLETSPVGFFAASKGIPRQYNWEYLFRYGVTHNLEFRIFSNGYSAMGGKHPTTGMSPLAFDFKINFWEENRKYLIPAVGLEVYITTTFGSKAFNGGTQPSLNLLLDQTLPFEINLEHNFSLIGRESFLGQSSYEFGYSWSLQRELVEDFDIFTHGFYNGGSLPRLAGFSTSVPLLDDYLSRHSTAVVAGAGGIWTINNRWAVFGSYNFGLTKYSPKTIALLGFAYAF